MSDMLARLMALAAMNSGGADLSDYYTKAETDRHISDEVARIVSDAPEDFDTLRELSDWIATHEESAAAMNSAIQANTAGVAALYAEVATKAPQSTTYTKTEVDTALAAKLNTSDVDADLSSTSTNPVQNKSVQAPIARLVDAGAKNIAAVGAAPSRSDLVIQVADGHVSISGTSTGTFTWQAVVFNDFVCETDMVIIGAETRTGINYQCRYTDSGGGVHYDQIPDGGILTIPAGSTIQYLYFQQNTVGVYISIEVDVMICTVEDYAISPEIVPYTPTMRELYEMILALQNAQNG